MQNVHFSKIVKWLKTTFLDISDDFKHFLFFSLKFFSETWKIYLYSYISILCVCVWLLSWSENYSTYDHNYFWW